MGQQTLSGAFTLSDPLSAYAYLNFVPVLIQLQTESTHEWLQLNSTRSDTLRADSKAAAGLSQPEREPGRAPCFSRLTALSPLSPRLSL